MHKIAALFLIGISLRQPSQHNNNNNSVHAIIQNPIQPYTYIPFQQTFLFPFLYFSWPLIFSRHAFEYVVVLFHLYSCINNLRMKQASVEIVTRNNKENQNTMGIFKFNLKVYLYKIVYLYVILITELKKLSQSKTNKGYAIVTGYIILVRIIH